MKGNVMSSQKKQSYRGPKREKIELNRKKKELKQQRQVWYTSVSKS